MKKLTAITLCTVLCLSIFAGCTKEEGKEAVDDVKMATKDIWGKVEEALGADTIPSTVDLDDEKLLEMYGINAADLEEYTIKTSALNVKADEYFIAKVKEGKMSDVEAGIAKRKSDLEDTWKQYLPDVYEYVKTSQVVKNGDYIMFVVSPDADKAVSTFNEHTKSKA